jgi:hypothetical protein
MIPGLQAHNLDGFGATRALPDRELDLVPFPQMADPAVRDGRIVDKDLALAIGLNIAKALGTVKPFYLTYLPR